MKSLTLALLLFITVSSNAFILVPNEKPLKTVSKDIRTEALGAILSGDLKKIKRLIAEGADPNFSVLGEGSIFHLISRAYFVQNLGFTYPKKFSEDSIRVLKYLHSLGVEPDRLDGPGGSTPLRLAFEGVSGSYPFCRAELIKAFLEMGADPDKGRRSAATYRVWSPYEYAHPFCGTEALEVYFSFKPNFKRGRCAFPSDTQEDQDTLNEHIGEGAYTPTVMLYKYFEKVGIPKPSLDGPFGPENNPEWFKYKYTCPDEIYYRY